MPPYALSLICCLLALPLQGLEIFDPEEVEYIRSRAKAPLGGSVALDCGAAMPAIFIWGFTRNGTDNSVALAYDCGHGAKLQAQSGGLGRLMVPENNATLVIEGLGREAEGMYTCQALYNADEGSRVTFYSTWLDMDDE